MGKKILIREEEKSIVKAIPHGVAFSLFDFCGSEW